MVNFPSPSSLKRSTTETPACFAISFLMPSSSALKASGSIPSSDPTAQVTLANLSDNSS
jgi:hypothetical protein